MKQECIKWLALDHITRDPTLQQRVATNPNHVEDLAAYLRENEGEMPSSALPTVYGADGKNYLADGYHTFEAHVAACFKKMKCLVRPGGHRDAWMHSLSANAAHGLKRSPADKRRAVTAALKDEETSKLSDTKISKLCGLTVHTLVSDVRRELAAGVDRTGMRHDGKGGWVKEDAPPGTRAARPKERDGDERVVGLVPQVTIVDPDPFDPFPDVVASTAEIEKAMAVAGEGTTGVFDAKGRPVGEDLVEVFADRSRINGIRGEFGKLSNELKRLKNGDGAELMPAAAFKWVDVSSVGKMVDDIQRTLRFGAPYIVCPKCGGKGRWNGEDCDVCKGCRFLPESAWSRLHQELQTLAEQWTPKGESFEEGTFEPILEVAA